MKKYEIELPAEIHDLLAKARKVNPSLSMMSDEGATHYLMTAGIMSDMADRERATAVPSDR